MLRRIARGCGPATAATTAPWCSSGLTTVPTTKTARRGLLEELPLIQHSAGLHIDAHATPSVLLNRAGRPKVIATIGPASSSEETIDAMIRAGMSVARFNMSHGSHHDHHRAMSLVRQRAVSLGIHVATALDTRGPEVRIGTFANNAASASSTGVESLGSATFNHGDRVTVSINPETANEMSNGRLFVDYGDLLAGPTRPTHFLLGDGSLELMVESVDLGKGECHCFVTRGATIHDRANVHVVGVDVALPLVSERDEADLDFGVANDVDFVFASFVRSARQLHELRGVLGARGRRASIIAKVETVAALNDLDAIIDASDGIMVARGDLGVALPQERAFFAQKKIIAACNIAGKPVICATQMLESMVNSPRPTRAETTDVANAVIDGADALMLSAESARGLHPEAAVRTLARISGEAVSFVRHRKRFSDMIRTMNLDDPSDIGADPVKSVSFTPLPHRQHLAHHVAPDASNGSAALSAEEARRRNLVRATLPRTIGYIAEAAVLTSLECQARCIVTATVSGNSVRKLRQCCPKAPIVAACKSPAVARQLSLVRGVTALYFADVEYSDFEALVDATVDYLKKRGDEARSNPLLEETPGVTVEAGDLVVVSCTDSVDPTDFTAYLKIRVVQ